MPCRSKDRKALHGASVLRHDVNDSIDRVGPPQRTPRSADNFDPVDALQRHVLHVPEDAAIKWVVGGAAIDEDQQLFIREAVEAAPRARGARADGGGAI